MSFVLSFLSGLGLASTDSPILLSSYPYDAHGSKERRTEKGNIRVLREKALTHKGDPNQDG